MTLPPLLAIGGPTASGKTDLAIQVALRLGGEIVNADSRQVYRGMDIGTAKPTVAQRGVVPHHLLDIIHPDQDFTLALYVRQARQAIAAIQAAGKLPILVGGTGLYLRAIVQGYQMPEVPPDPTLRRRLEQEAAEQGIEALLARLRTRDPDAAARIDGRNPRRVIRALEVSESLGVSASSARRREADYRALLVILTGERTALYARAGTRLESMLAVGFEDEVAGLLAAGYGLDLPALSALGYREIARYLRGESTREAALEATRASTHAFIRRQLTWFRAESAAETLPMEDAALVDRVVGLAQCRLLRT